MVNTKEKILRSTLEVASEVGMGNVSLQKIADRVGVRKATLFSHYRSKDEIFTALYTYLRENISQKHQTESFDYLEFIQGKTATEILTEVVFGYKRMNETDDLAIFYKFISSERVLNPMAAKIMVTETETMLAKTRALLVVMRDNELLSFPVFEAAVTSFCMTIHGLLDLTYDYRSIGEKDKGEKMLAEYIEYFCQEYASS